MTYDDHVPVLEPGSGGHSDLEQDISALREEFAHTQRLSRKRSMTARPPSRLSERVCKWRDGNINQNNTDILDLIERLERVEKNNTSLRTERVVKLTITDRDTTIAALPKMVTSFCPVERPHLT